MKVIAKGRISAVVRKGNLFTQRPWKLVALYNYLISTSQMLFILINQHVTLSAN